MSSILMKQKQDDPKPSKKTIKYLKLLTIKEPMKIHEEKDHIFFYWTSAFQTCVIHHQGLIHWIIIDPETMTFSSFNIGNRFMP